MATRATFLDGDNRVYMTIEEESFAEVSGFLLRNGWVAKRPEEKDFPLTVKDSAGNEFAVNLESLPALIKPEAKAQAEIDHMLEEQAAQ
jgi:hypothetical protein